MVGAVLSSEDLVPAVADVAAQAEAVLAALLAEARRPPQD